MESTISIFKIYLRHLPQALPEHLSAKADRILDEIKNNEELTLEDVENMMVDFGYQAWPWHKAYKEYLHRATDQMFDHLVGPKLDGELAAKFQKYRQYGMPSEELFSGASLRHYFESTEIPALTAAIIEAKQHGADLADRHIAGQHKEKFLDRVIALNNILTEIKTDLNLLRNMAENEKEHPELAAEILAKVKKFEQGLVLLAPEPELHEVTQAVEFFTGRKHDLNRMKGIYQPIDIDFYTQPIDPWVC